MGGGLLPRKTAWSTTNYYYYYYYYYCCCCYYYYYYCYRMWMGSGQHPRLGWGSQILRLRRNEGLPKLSL